MISRLIDFALLGLSLLMFQVCEIIGIAKIKLFNFSVTERAKENKKNLKTIQNLTCKKITFKKFLQKPKLFLFFPWKLNLFLRETCCADLNTNLLSSNISKLVRVSIVFTITFFKEYSISFLMISRLIDFALLVL